MGHVTIGDVNCAIYFTKRRRLRFVRGVLRVPRLLLSRKRHLLSTVIPFSLVLPASNALFDGVS
jgi:hypothetical protein